MPALRPGENETYPRGTSFEKRQPVAVTLSNSFDDWSIAQLARALNKSDDEKLFLSRATNYKNLFRTDKGLMRPKDAAGHWVERWIQNSEVAWADETTTTKITATPIHGM